MEIDDVAKIAEVRAAANNGEARKLRLSRRLSLSDIAVACEVDQSTVWRWETGMRRPRGPAALRYAHVLDLIRKAVK